MTSPLTPERKREIGERIEKANAGEFWPVVRHIDVSDLYESHEALVEALAGLLSRIDHVGPEIGLACFHGGINIPNIATEAEAARAALRNAGVEL